MMTDILISEAISGPAVDELSERFRVETHPELWNSSDALKEKLRLCRALIVRNQTQVTGELLQAAEKLEVIGRAGAGVDNIDVKAASARGIRVVYTPAENSISVAELTIGLMLSTARMIPSADRSTKAGGWERKQFVGVELYGKTLGIVGFGRIGKLTAERAAAFGMKLLVFDPYVQEKEAVKKQFGATLVSLEELLQASDFVSCHLPCTAETKGLFGIDQFQLMKSTAIFISAARGEIVKEADLIRALNENEIAGAGLDVREVEPPAASPLQSFDNVVLTPHIAAFTKEAQERVVDVVCNDVAAVLGNEPAQFCFNESMIPNPVTA